VAFELSRARGRKPERPSSGVLTEGSW